MGATEYKRQSQKSQHDGCSGKRPGKIAERGLARLGQTQGCNWWELCLAPLAQNGFVGMAPRPQTPRPGIGPHFRTALEAGSGSSWDVKTHDTKYVPCHRAPSRSRTATRCALRACQSSVPGPRCLVTSLDIKLLVPSITTHGFSLASSLLLMTQFSYLLSNLSPHLTSTSLPCSGSAP